MQVLITLVAVLQVVAALSMIGLVLVQHGKGADMGASFGSGSSGSLFGASGSANFLSRSTAVAATVFFSSTLALAYFGSHRELVAPSGEASVLERAAAPVAASGSSSSFAASAAAPGLVPSMLPPVAAPAASAISLVPAASGAALIPTK